MSKTDPKGRARKAAVYAGIPRKDRRAMQTAGLRDNARATMLTVNAAIAMTHRANKSSVMAAYMETGIKRPPEWAQLEAQRRRDAAEDGFHAAIAAPIGKAPPAIDPLRAKRSEAAKRAAATRKANRQK